MCSCSPVQTAAAAHQRMRDEIALALSPPVERQMNRPRQLRHLEWFLQERELPGFDAAVDHLGGGVAGHQDRAHVGPAFSEKADLLLALTV